MRAARGAAGGRTAATSATAPTTRPVTRRRSIWPWLIALGAVLAVAVGGWFLYDNVQNQIEDNKPLAVQQYTGIVESKAVDLISADGFEPKVRRLPNDDQPVGIVFEQSPTEGTSLDEGRHRHDPRLDGQEERERA